ncbi:MAG TPA: CHAT domain-containing protein [Nitrososphaera sp.]|nr:CHAT domain-containing protein [Nitrososphaera sp.]
MSSLEKTNVKSMQKTVTFLKWEPKRDFYTDNLVCRVRFSIIDSALIGTPRERESIHTIEVIMTDMLMSNWRIPGGMDFGITEEMIKVALQSLEDYLVEQLKKGPLPEGKLQPLSMTTENSPKSCPYKLANIPYPSKTAFTVDVDDRVIHAGTVSFHPKLSLSQVIAEYEGQRIKAKGNDRKDQFFVHKGELHYIDLGAAEICEKQGLPYKDLKAEEEFILTQAARGDDYNGLQMKAVLEEIGIISENKKRRNNVISILFLAADPTDASSLRLGEELREIQEKLQLAKWREQFELHQRMSVRPADISQALLDVQPRIVHFSGHGTASGAICFENPLGDTHPIQPDALAALFEQFANQISCVVLNACYSEIQANAIAIHIDYVVGMNQAIGDKAAIAFAIGFYQALGAGRTIEEAYKLGCVQIRLQSIPEHLTPVLIKKGQAQS